MSDNHKSYYINNPVFVKYKKQLEWTKLKRLSSLKSVCMNERIVEGPFALQHLRDLKEGARVLDIGCTESLLPLQAAHLGYKVTGYDFRRYPYYHPNLTFVQGDMLKLPFPRETFNGVTCISTLEHVGIGFYKDPKRVEEADQNALEEINRVLKKQGVLILSVPYGIAQRNSFQRIYNGKRLHTVLKDFKIETQRYYRSENNERSLCNFWQETDEAQASKIKSDERTQCVCLLKAIKK